MDSEDEGMVEKASQKQKKSPFQKRGLLKAYAECKYPSDQARAQLAADLELTGKQLQMWFCHERRKEKLRSNLKHADTPGSPGDMPLGAEAYEVAMKKAKRRREAEKCEPGLDGGMLVEGFLAAALADEIEDSELLAGQRNGVDKKKDSWSRSKKQKDVSEPQHDQKVSGFRPSKTESAVDTDFLLLNHEETPHSTRNGTTAEDSGNLPTLHVQRKSIPGNRSATLTGMVKLPKQILGQGVGPRPADQPITGLSPAAPTLRIKMPRGVGSSARIKMPNMRPPILDTTEDEPSFEFENFNGEVDAKLDLDTSALPPGQPLGRPLRRSEMTPPMWKKKKNKDKNIPFRLDPDTLPENIYQGIDASAHPVLHYPTANGNHAMSLAADPRSSSASPDGYPTHPSPFQPLHSPSPQPSPTFCAIPPFSQTHGALPSRRQAPPYYPSLQSHEYTGGLNGSAAMGGYSNKWMGAQRRQGYGNNGNNIGGSGGYRYHRQGFAEEEEEEEEEEEDMEVQEAVQMQALLQAQAEVATAMVAVQQAKYDTLQARRRAAEKKRARQGGVGVAHVRRAIKRAVQAEDGFQRPLEEKMDRREREEEHGNACMANYMAHQMQPMTDKKAEAKRKREELVLVRKEVREREREQEVEMRREAKERKQHLKEDMREVAKQDREMKKIMLKTDKREDYMLVHKSQLAADEKQLKDRVVTKESEVQLGEGGGGMETGG